MPIHQGGFLPSGNGSSFEPTPAPTSGSLELGTPTQDPPASAYADAHPTNPRGSFPKDRITHALARPLGEDPRSYPQIQPNATGARDSVKYGQAIPKSLSHGAASHGGPQGEVRNMSVGVEPKSAPMPRHVPDSSYVGAGHGRPDSMKRRGVSG